MKVGRKNSKENKTTKIEKVYGSVNISGYFKALYNQKFIKIKAFFCLQFFLLYCLLIGLGLRTFFA